LLRAWCQASIVKHNSFVQLIALTEPPDCAIGSNPANSASWPDPMESLVKKLLKADAADLGWT